MISKQKKKILHIIPCYAIGGAEILVLNYARHLNKDKYEMYVANTAEDGELSNMLKRAGANVFIGSRKRDNGRFVVWRKLKKYIGDLKPDIIHSHLFGADFLAFLIKRSASWPVKWISTQHNVEFQTPFWRRVAWRYILRRADKVVAVSSAVYEHANRYFKVPKAKMELIMNGIDFGKWLVVPISEKPADRKDFAIATIGRLAKQKGHIYLIEALSRIKDMPFKWHVYGDGNLRNKLRDRAKLLGISEKIVWEGIKENLAEELRKIDLVVQPSLWEGLSMVIMEAMAAGKCVLATETAGAELIKHQETGYLVPIADSSALSKAICYLYDNEQTRLNFGQNAQACAINNFGLDKNLAALERVYDA